MSATAAQVVQWLEALPTTATRRSSGVHVGLDSIRAPQEGTNGNKACAITPQIDREVENNKVSPPRTLSSQLSPTSTSSSQEPSQDVNTSEPHFLSLPAELRNDIYRYAILSDDKIKIATNMAQPPQEPAMLRVNRQTRHEALGIYYQENHFRFDMHNFDARAYTNWIQAKPIIRGRLQVWFKLYLITSSELAWKNLMAWLEAIHVRKVFHGPSDRAFPGKKKHRIVAGELKQLAASMRGQGLSWNNVLANLTYSKRMLAASSANGEWV
ncbi:hypothetical protein Slin15195_G117250 [Septoria linicola]|uniref:2EXR domain-containing protein n=1 Tax=Septoria linicola TaxID=215465 RepID=A0A9Q9B8P3_9PEZI|nr:hypothetical protein Slin14017_G094250 [Septoria linicola]USW58406.1 hypothetical protein Slin15195_G117250 [Septoria linicola]